MQRAARHLAVLVVATVAATQAAAQPAVPALNPADIDTTCKPCDNFYKYATERQTLFFTADDRIELTRRYTVVTSPVSYVGIPEVTREIQLLQSAVGDTRRAFLTSTAPASLEVYRGNEYYAKPDDYVFALADALRIEY